jgi:stalled ribosome rescue protein Dom34
MKKKIKEIKKVAVWLDHKQAHFIKFKKGKLVIETIESGKETQVRFKGETGIGTKLGKTRSTNQEFKQHEKLKNTLHKYYKELGKALAKYDFVYLFGPTTAKSELLNYNREHSKASGKTFVVDSTDSMTFPQMVARAKAVIGSEA